MVGGNSIIKSFLKVSEVKCDTYLSEFPNLQPHFSMFAGSSKTKYTRQELFDLMESLSPNGNNMIQDLYEAGILLPNTTVANATSFEIPKLFRSGLKMNLRGRP